MNADESELKKMWHYTVLCIGALVVAGWMVASAAQCCISMSKNSTAEHIKEIDKGIIRSGH